VPIKVSKRDLADCVVGVCFPYVETPYGWADPVILSVWPHVMDIRRMGAAALDLAYVAAGSFDATFFRRIAWWDIAAGMLLVKEAGGKATEFNGNPLTPNYQSFIAGEPVFVDWFRKSILLFIFFVSF
jgi:myo-inositol-1(or 4)-monophosphatase